MGACSRNQYKSLIIYMARIFNGPIVLIEIKLYLENTNDHLARMNSKHLTSDYPLFEKI